MKTKHVKKRLAEFAGGSFVSAHRLGAFDSIGMMNNRM